MEEANDIFGSPSAQTHPRKGKGSTDVPPSCFFLSRFHSACSVLQEFSAEERDPVKITEGWGVMFTCSPPPHYPGEQSTGFPDFLGVSGKEIWG